VRLLLALALAGLAALASERRVVHVPPLAGSRPGLAALLSEQGGGGLQIVGHGLRRAPASGLSVAPALALAVAGSLAVEAGAVAAAGIALEVLAEADPHDLPALATGRAERVAVEREAKGAKLVGEGHGHALAVRAVEPNAVAAADDHRAEGEGAPVRRADLRRRRFVLHDHNISASACAVKDYFTTTYDSPKSLERNA
jgi:hypothetical protein